MQSVNKLSESIKNINKVSYSLAEDSAIARALSVDQVIVEQPLQITLCWQQAQQQKSKVFAITMRTPGYDKQLIMGLLFSEGVINGPADVSLIEQESANSHEQIELSSNQWLVHLSADTTPVLDSLDQYQMTYSSCGLCGTTSIKNLELKAPCLPRIHNAMVNSRELFQLAEVMKNEQRLFRQTGGVHGAALFDHQMCLLHSYEDIGRHNAVDKVVGAHLITQCRREKQLLSLVVSGRISFEIVQKTLMAGISILIGVGAPSDLAIQAAKRFDLTLIGFANAHSFNVYHGDWRITR